MRALAALGVARELALDQPGCAQAWREVDGLLGRGHWRKAETLMNFPSEEKLYTYLENLSRVHKPRRLKHLLNCPQSSNPRNRRTIS